MDRKHSVRNSDCTELKIEKVQKKNRIILTSSRVSFISITEVNLKLNRAEKMIYFCFPSRQILGI